jgi:hypothetical protein
MKNKKTLESRIRGWFPSTPTLPQLKGKSSKIRNLGVQTNLPPPPPPSLETKFQRGSGLAIGIGLGILMIGSMGALFSYQAYSEVTRVLNYAGLDTDIYVLRDLLDQTAIYLTLVVGGAYAVVYGALALRSRFFREISFNREPHARLGGALMGGGGALTLMSFQHLFIYLFGVHDPRINFLELQFFVGSFVIGASLMSMGIIAYTRKAKATTSNS